MECVATFNKNKSLFLEAVERLSTKNSFTLGDFLVEWQMKFINGWVGVKSTDEVIIKVFQAATRSFKPNYSTSFLILNINDGICKSLGLPEVLPRTASGGQLYEWAIQNDYKSDGFKRGDILIWRTSDEYDHAGVVEDINIADKILITLEGYALEDFGVASGIQRSYKFEDRKQDFALRGAIDMSKIYNTLITRGSHAK